MNMNDSFIADLINDLNKVFAEMLDLAPRNNSRREYGVAFAARRGIKILEREDDIDAAIEVINECVIDDRWKIMTAICPADKSYYKGRLSLDEDILGSLKTIKDLHNMTWMMTGVRLGKNQHRVKMWCVDAEDKRRIEEAGNTIMGNNEMYVAIEFIPW